MLTLRNSVKLGVTAVSLLAGPGGDAGAERSQDAFDAANMALECNNAAHSLKTGKPHSQEEEDDEVAALTKAIILDELYRDTHGDKQGDLTINKVSIYEQIKNRPIPLHRCIC